MIQQQQQQQRVVSTAELQQLLLRPDLAPWDEQQHW
jgi:hypothetical protein